MKSTKIIIPLIIVALLSLVYIKNQYAKRNMIRTNEQKPAPEEIQVVEEVEIQLEPELFNMEQVAEHSTPEDCWIVIDNKVYDVSNFGQKHAGGDAVYAGCGIDATELFNTRPMGSETQHSEKAFNALPNFYIGDLNN